MPQAEPDRLLLERLGEPSSLPFAHEHPLAHSRAFFGVHETQARSNENEASAGALSIITEPAGATAYVDGKIQGPTPLVVDGLPAGDHRIKLIKDGYLENSRVLSLKADRAATVQVKLTPSNERNTAAVEAQVGTGGGGSIWTNPLFWGAVGAGGATLAYLALRDTNKPPVANLKISPTGAGTVGLTTFMFEAGGSTDPDGDPLTYSWNFGDGSTAAGTSVSHIFDSAGSHTVTLPSVTARKQTRPQAASM